MPETFHSTPGSCSSVYLSWKDLNVSISQAHGISRLLLDNCSGCAEPGKVVAVMGPSGSGKTTLLNALSGRLSGKTKQSGVILVNGRRQQLTYGNSAYVGQDESMIETLTVYEAIMYSAKLQLSETISSAEKIARVETTINEMGLQDCVHTKIGGWNVRGLSGGEKRRVSIAIEIVKRPQLLFLDEPTTGLDSAAAFRVMKRLRELVKDGRTLIASIHQPSSEIFMMFHSLCLLSKGKTMYFGEAKNSQQFFAEFGFPCPTFRNPSDHLLWVVTSELEQDIETGDLSGNVRDIEMGDTSDNVKQHPRADILARAYSSSVTALKIKDEIEKLSIKTGVILQGGRDVCFWRQTFYLTCRSFINMHRDVTYYWFRLLVYLALAFCAGTIYFRVGHTYNSIQARANMLMFNVTFITFLGLVCFQSFIKDLKIFTRERLNGHYGVAAFVISNSLSSFPFLFLLSVLPGAILYFLGDFHPGFGRFVFFTVTVLSCLVAVESLLMAVASMVPDFLTGIIVGSGILGLYLLNGGFFRSLKDLPKPFWRYPMSYIAFHTYANRAFYNNDFSGLQFENYEHGSTPVSGEEVLRDVLQMDTSYCKWWNVAILFGMAIFYRLLFFLCIKLRETLSSLK